MIRLRLLGFAILMAAFFIQLEHVYAVLHIPVRQPYRCRTGLPLSQTPSIHIVPDEAENNPFVIQAKLFLQ